MVTRYDTEALNHLAQAMAGHFKKKTKIFTLFLSLVFFVSCASRQTAATLDDVETYIQSRPDSALATLRTIDTTTLATRSLRAHYALLHAMALDKNWIDTADVNVVMPAVRYYDRHRPVTNRAKPYYYLGRIQYNGGRYADAIVSFTRAREYAEALDDNRFKALNDIALANTYTATSAYEEALNAMRDAEIWGQRTQDTMLRYTIMFNQAQYLVNLKRFQEADVLFQQLTEEGNPFVERFPQTRSSYAMFLITPPNQQYQQARSLFEETLHKTGRLESVQYWGMYAICLANTGDIKAAESILSRLEKDKKAKHLSMSNTKSLVYAAKGDFESAYRFLRENQDQLNEEVQTRLRQSAMKAQRDYYMLQKESLEKENRLRRWINVLLLLFAASAIFALFGIVRRFREKVRSQNRDLMEMARDMMELRKVNESLSSDKEMAYTKQIALRQEFFHLNQESFKELSELCNTYFRNEGSSSEAGSVCGEVRGLMKRLGIGADRYPVLEQRINEKFDHVMDHFRTEHPNHREQFFQTSCYLFAGFKTRTIALLLHLDEQDVYQLKWRMKKEIENKETPHKSDFMILLNGPSNS